jgi:hypothetical protein
MLRTYRVACAGDRRRDLFDHAGGSGSETLSQAGFVQYAPNPNASSMTTRSCAAWRCRRWYHHRRSTRATDPIGGQRPALVHLTHRLSVSDAEPPHVPGGSLAWSHTDLADSESRCRRRTPTLRLCAVNGVCACQYRLPGQRGLLALPLTEKNQWIGANLPQGWQVRQPGGARSMAAPGRPGLSGALGRSRIGPQPSFEVLRLDRDDAAIVPPPPRPPPAARR